MQKNASVKTFWWNIWQIFSWKPNNFLPLLSSAWNQSTSRLEKSSRLGDSSNHCCGWKFPCRSHQDEKTRSGHNVNKRSRIYGGRWKIQRILSSRKGTSCSTSNRLFSFHFLVNPIKQRSSCRNHRAVNAANSNSRRNLDATGVIACCCARHGCFIPTSVCDLQKGER